MEIIFVLFPKWQSEIDRLYQEDEDFQEMCTDYVEVSTLLVNWKNPEATDQANIAEYKELLRKLETEIIETLKYRYQTINSTDQSSPTQLNHNEFQGGDDDNNLEY